MTTSDEGGKPDMQAAPVRLFPFRGVLTDEPWAEAVVDQVARDRAIYGGPPRVVPTKETDQ